MTTLLQHSHEVLQLNERFLFLFLVWAKYLLLNSQLLLALFLKQHRLLFWHLLFFLEWIHCFLVLLFLRRPPWSSGNVTGLNKWKVRGSSRGATWPNLKLVAFFPSGPGWQMWLEHRANYYMPPTTTYVYTCMHVGKYVRVLRFPPPIKLTATIWPKMLKLVLKHQSINLPLLRCTVYDLHWSGWDFHRVSSFNFHKAHSVRISAVLQISHIEIVSVLTLAP